MAPKRTPEKMPLAISMYGRGRQTGQRKRLRVAISIHHEKHFFIRQAE